MSTRNRIGLALVLVLGGVLATPAAADAPERRIAVAAVGGVEDFYDYGMRHATRLNGIWGVRGSVDVERYFQLEAAYLGSAGKIVAPIGGLDATLVGHSVETIGRLTGRLGGRVRPYAFFGIAWRRYDVLGADFTTMDTGMHDSDDLLQTPMGAGFAYHRGGLVVDARLTFRATAGEGLLVEDDDYAAMDTWGIQGALGYEF